MLLTRSLLPSINSQNGRVLFASSSTMYTVNGLNLDMPLKSYSYNGLDHYAHSKACVAQLVPRLAKTTSAKIYCMFVYLEIYTRMIDILTDISIYSLSSRHGSYKIICHNHCIQFATCI